MTEREKKTDDCSLCLQPLTQRIRVRIGDAGEVESNDTRARPIDKPREGESNDTRARPIDKPSWARKRIRRMCLRPEKRRGPTRQPGQAKPKTSQPSG
jgi:hypothetical protein